MSVCTFLASDYPLPSAAPPKDYPIEINIDTGMIDDGGADDNYYLHLFDDVDLYADKKYGVMLEWNYADGRAEQIIKYIKEALNNTDSIELWHVWLGDYYEYEDSPVTHSRIVSVKDISIEDIKEIDSAKIWNQPDKIYPNRPSFYRMIIKR